MTRSPRRVLVLGLAVALAAAACSAGGGGLTKVRFQLQWVAQAQFAGYYAAQDQGYYKDAGLDVSFILGGPNIDNIQAVAAGNADIGTGWLPKMLQSRENGPRTSRSRPTSTARRSGRGSAATSPSCSPPSTRSASTRPSRTSSSRTSTCRVCSRVTSTWPRR